MHPILQPLEHPPGRSSTRPDHHRPRALGLGVVALVTAIALGGCLPSSLRPTPAPTPTPSPAPTPSPTPSPTPGPPTPTPGPTFVLYTVRRGDTLTRIARRFRTDGRSIAYWNRETYPSLDPESPKYDPDRLARDWVLRLIPGGAYEAPADDGETGEQVTPEPEDTEVP